ncbi:hypothetical protein ACFOGI_00540 [Virgibacillus xinjiangensis]|uniref:YjzC-like protein n=1 Tax=Virgibacillus xinjiangensis TaxID=393090 RepID=A0ABV7CQX0_9BACI
MIFVKEDYREYRTGQGVPHDGEFICQSGKKATLAKHETFPSCPVSGNETTWKPEKQ